MNFAVENKDLVWDLQAFKESQRATDFVMGFENKLCVFSESVEQLYTNYNIFFPREENRKLIILPNPYAHHDTFHDVNPLAVRPTTLNIVPGELVGREGLYLSIPFKSGKSRFRIVPLQTGLNVIRQKQSDARPLLPVLKKGDLRELNANIPCLHLHTLDLDKLESLSSLERDSIRKVIEMRLASLT